MKKSTRIFSLVISLVLTAGLLLSFSPIQTSDLFAQTPLKESKDLTTLELIDHTHYLEDKSGQLTITDLTTKPFPESWKKIESSKPNFGYTNSAYWLKLNLHNSSASTQYVLEIAYPVLDYIDIYILEDGKQQHHYQLGDKYPFSQRLIDHRNFLVPFTIKEKQSLQFYIRVKSSSAMQIPLSLQSPDHILKNTQDETLALGIYYGMVSVMVLYNLFVFFSVREVNYLYYVFYVISMLLFLASLNGISFQYLWPNSIWWNDQSIIFMLCSVIVFACLFTPRFLNLSTCRPKLNNLFTLLTIAGFLLTLASFLLPYNIMILITLVLAMIGISTSMIAAIVRFMDGYTPAKYYIYGWSFMLLGGVILAANKAGLVPRNLFTENTLQLGSAMEVVLLSLALADRLHVEKSERFEAQRQALEIQKQATELLEARVAERTSELEVVNRKLQELSTTDGLTAIGNRRFFDDMLVFEFARAQREQHFLTLMLIDIDNFKLLNDNYGHVIGDECLKIVAQKIKQQLQRETDIVARYGGEEFVVLLANTNQEASEKLANNIRTAMHTVKELAGGIKPNLTVSLGVIVTIPTAQDSPQGLLKLADDALYRSKDNGRDQVSMA